MDSTYHYPVKVIFQAHLRMYSLIHTDSLAQPRKLLCFKVFAMYSQCKVFLHLKSIHKISLNKVIAIRKIIPAHKITANLVVLNLAVKMHNVRSRNYYISRTQLQFGNYPTEVGQVQIEYNNTVWV
jgi:hypothetical protein